MRKRRVLILILILFIAVISIYVRGIKDVKVYELVDSRESLMNSSYTPSNGVSIDEALIIVSKYLKNESSIKGDFESEIEFEEITNMVIWENNSHQVYRVKIDYAWLDGIIILKNGEVEKLLWGQDIINVITADLDGDGDYEICMNSNFGSGFVRSLVHVYDSTSGQEYEIENNEDTWDISIGVDKTKTAVYVYENEMNGTEESKRTLGKLRISNEKLIIVD